MILTAVAECRAALGRHDALESVLFCCFDAGMLAIYDEALARP